MKYILIIGAIIVVGVGGWLYFHGSGNSYTASTPTPTVTATATKTPTPVPTQTPSPTPGLIVHEAATHTVVLQNFSFNPSSTTVQKGDIVIFKNMDPTQHTVTSDTGVFDSGHLDPSTQWTLTTANMAPGTYPFHCNIHTTMHGILIIQ
jgi:plastocyanin